MRILKLASVFILILASCQPRGSKPEAIDLRCEYLANPIGISVGSPRLSWKMKKETRGARQTAYRIMAATNEERLMNEKPDLWDSGKIGSDQSIQVDYKGKPLTSGMNIRWKVQIWDEENHSSPWSSMANWEMGLLDKNDWKAKWIGAPATLATKEVRLPSPLFRKEVSITRKIRTARAYISGLGYYELYINGLKIGDHVLSPNQSNYDRRNVEKWNETKIGNMKTSVYYEVFDIAPTLKSGGNAFGIILGNGWYIQADRPQDTMLWYDTPRVIAQFIIDYEDGTKDLITTGQNWKCSSGPIRYNGLHSGEIYDARLEQKGWDEPGFDESRWSDVELVRPPTGELKSQISPPDRITKIIHPIGVTLREKGVYRFDMGQMFSGWARLKISGPKGTMIQMKYSEELGPTYNQSDTYILKGEGIETWQPRFTWHAFRYVDVLGATTALSVENMDGLAVNTDVGRAGTFDCSNALFNKILENYQRTQLGNMHGGIPSDCPHRERRGYTGDGQISAKSAIYNFDQSQFYTKWLDDISDAQNQVTGYVPNTAPYQDGGGGTAWGSAYLIIPWYMYQYYGDIRILKNHYSGMKHWIEYLKGELDKDGILVNQGLGEWVPPSIVELPPDFVNTCYYYHCCQIMSDISDIIGNQTDKNYFSDLASKAATSVNTVYCNKESSIYSIGRQGANLFPLGFGITEKEKEVAVLNNLIDTIVKGNKSHFDTGILGTPLLLDVLTGSGRSDLAYTLMNQRDYPGYGYMIGKGATTIWETWQGDASHSHPMFGSVCAWFYQALGGISPDPKFPGFKQIVIKPYPVRSLTYANTTYPSMYGEIKSKWEFVGDDYQMSVRVPANTTAMVYIPAGDGAKVTESGEPISHNPNVEYLKSEGQYAVYKVNSGTYLFYSKGVRKILKHPALPTPVIEPGDTLVQRHDTVMVKISADDGQAKICFTVDGSEPDASSTVYHQPFKVSKPSVIKAKAFLEGADPSGTSVNVIDFIDKNSNGLTFKYYEGVWTRLPDFLKFPVIKTGTVYQFGLDRIVPAKDEFALSFEGKIEIGKEGVYEFFVLSNDGSCLYVDNKLVIDNDGQHGADHEKSGRIKLSSGLHPIRLNYFQAGGGMFLSLKYSGPELVKQEVPAKVLFQK